MLAISGNIDIIGTITETRSFIKKEV